MEPTQKMRPCFALAREMANVMDLSESVKEKLRVVDNMCRVTGGELRSRQVIASILVTEGIGINGNTETKE